MNDLKSCNLFFLQTSHGQMQQKANGFKTFKVGFKVAQLFVLKIRQNYY